MTIREIAAKTNMSTDTLRYYERIGLLPPVPRNAAGIRNYDEYFVNFINILPFSFRVLAKRQKMCYPIGIRKKTRNDNETDQYRAP